MEYTKEETLKMLIWLSKVLNRSDEHYHLGGTLDADIIPEVEEIEWDTLK